MFRICSISMNKLGALDTSATTRRYGRRRLQPCVEASPIKATKRAPALREPVQEEKRHGNGTREAKDTRSCAARIRRTKSFRLFFIGLPIAKRASLLQNGIIASFFAFRSLGIIHLALYPTFNKLYCDFWIANQEKLYNRKIVASVARSSCVTRLSHSLCSHREVSRSLLSRHPLLLSFKDLSL